MAYSKQTFTAGQTLKAEHLNHIEKGITDVEASVTTLKQKVDSLPSGDGNLSVSSDGNGNVTLRFV